MSPLISVYITTFNRLAFLDRALSSVQNQSYSNIEIIVVDDNSTDGTSDFLKEKSSKDNRIVVLTNSPNLGAPLSRNRAINAAKGEYITGLDDDDYFGSDRIFQFVQAVNNACEASVYFSDYVILGKDKEKKIKGPDVVDLALLLKGNYLGNQVFAKTEWVRSVGGFDARFPAWQDYDAWTRLVKKYGPAKRVPVSSYTVDQSHDLERITKSKSDKIELACRLFCEKNCPNEKSKLSVRLNLYGYPGYKFGLRDLFFYFYNGIYIRPFKLYLKGIVNDVQT